MGPLPKPLLQITCKDLTLLITFTSRSFQFRIIIMLSISYSKEGNKIISIHLRSLHRSIDHLILKADVPLAISEMEFAPACLPFRKKNKLEIMKLVGIKKLRQ